ncbi:MAG: hypothetical protein GWO24_10960, partial [Akkermansiaceae bacterium]|nr:hypothetical protein [Akkermansiaceae bacterium]
MKLFGTITLASCLLLPPLAPAGPISYQGRLDDNGQPANGLYSMRFTVFDDAVAGAALDSGVTVSNIPVSDGLFTARF